MFNYYCLILKLRENGDRIKDDKLGYINVY